jgi:hypothetical protein
MLFRSFLLIACLTAPAAALAQTAPAPASACATMDAEVPAELAGWADKTPLSAASVAADLSKASLTLGKAFLATLPATSSVTYVVAPEKPGDPASHGGLFGLNIPTAGTYVVALGAGAWVDVLRDGASVRSSSHGHGPACSTVRKIVAFELQPGRHVVQIVGSVPAALSIMVARRP